MVVIPVPDLLQQQQAAVVVESDESELGEYFAIPDVISILVQARHTTLPRQLLLPLLLKLLLWLDDHASSSQAALLAKAGRGQQPTLVVWV